MKTQETSSCYDSFPTAYYDLYFSIEFSWKALRLLAIGDQPPHHLPTKETFDETFSHLTMLTTEWDRKEVEAIFSKYNPTWQKNPASRAAALYGDAIKKVPPSAFETEANAKEFLLDVEKGLLPVLINVQREALQKSEYVPVGILSGYFSEDAQRELPCREAFWADQFGDGLDPWVKGFQEACVPVQLTRVSVSSLSCDSAVVINPFGELYPEMPSTPEVLPGYTRIKHFIFCGGMFVTLSGHPFHRFWDVRTGKAEDTSVIVPNYPVGLIVDEDYRIREIQYTTLIQKMLVNRDFGLEVIWDEPGQTGPIEISPYQKDEDKKFWDGSQLPKVLRVYRAVIPTGAKHIVPVVRASIRGKEAYPIAFAKYGFGGLLHIGLDLSKSCQIEAALAMSIIRGLLPNLRNVLQT